MAAFRNEYFNDMADRLREAFDYNPDTGVIHWKTRPREHFSCDRMYKKHCTGFAGQVAGNYGKDGRGVVGITFDCVNYLIGASQLAWVLAGRCLTPGMLIDHINGNPGDNRLRNLRECTATENSWNSRVNRRNTSGCTGVKFNQGKWVASITINGEWRSLGRFANKNDAITARRKAEVEIKGEFLPSYLESELTEEEERWVNSIGSL